MAITRYYKFIEPQSPDANIGDNQPTVGGGLYGNYTWYHRLIQGSPTRLTRYREYDAMDADNDVSIALDMIAEEMVGNASKNTMPFNIKFNDALEKGVKPALSSTIHAALRTWTSMHDWQNRLFTLARNTIKYGDVYFERPKVKNKKFKFVHPKNVLGAIIKEDDVTDIRGWQIKIDSKFLNTQSYGGGYNLNNTTGNSEFGVKEFAADDVIRFTLNDEMSEEAPFGKSILSCVYRAFKHKELLEDSLIIYRIQRAPEKRVFYINTGRMHPQKVAQHLEQIKNEIKQKKIPSSYGGKNTVESVYNPQAMSEDFFFSVGPDGQGSRVETLPGGQSLGELADLDYFYAKLWRGLRIPQSYISNSVDNANYNDGKVGIAYLQEIKFSLYIEHLQSFLERVFDVEFKRFLHENGIRVDPSLFHVMLPEPSNFAKSRQQQMDNDLLSTYSTASGMNEFSKRFALKKYAQLSESEIIENERMKRQEMGLNPYGDDRDLPKIYNPDAAEAGGFEGGLGNISGGSSGGGGGGMGGEPESVDELPDDFVDGVTGSESADGETTEDAPENDAKSNNKAPEPTKNKQK